MGDTIIITESCVVSFVVSAATSHQRARELRVALRNAIAKWQLDSVDVGTVSTEHACTGSVADDPHARAHG